jgi:hypothetical protein
MRRRASIYVSPEQILELLELPAGTRVLHIEGRCDPLTFRVVVEHPALEEIPPDSEAPRIYPLLIVNTDEQGHVTRSSRWPAFEPRCEEPSSDGRHACWYAPHDGDHSWAAPPRDTTFRDR